MIINDCIRQLTHLQEAGQKRELDVKNLNYFDEINSIPNDEHASWCRVISGVATTETIESIMLNPLITSLKRLHKERPHLDLGSIVAYLETHGQDERRHAYLLSEYLKHTFNFEKNKKTISDRIFYDYFFPILTKIFYYKPLYGFILLRSYEKLSLDFYQALFPKAKENKMDGLLGLIHYIKIDEARHLRGMELMQNLLLGLGNSFSRTEYLIVKALLNMMMLDINMSKWALHNWSMRSHLKKLNVDTKQFTSKAYESITDSLIYVKNLYASL